MAFQGWWAPQNLGQRDHNFGPPKRLDDGGLPWRANDTHPSRSRRFYAASRPVSRSKKRLEKPAFLVPAYLKRLPSRVVVNTIRNSPMVRSSSFSSRSRGLDPAPRPLSDRTADQSRQSSAIRCAPDNQLSQAQKRYRISRTPPCDRAITELPKAREGFTCKRFR